MIISNRFYVLFKSISHATDSRVKSSCSNSSEKYVSSIDECIDGKIASLPAFLSALLVTRTCNSSTITSLQELEYLRLCDVINGTLEVNIIDINEFSDQLSFI